MDSQITRTIIILALVCSVVQATAKESFNPEQNSLDSRLIEIKTWDGYSSPAILEFPDGEGPFPGIVAVHWGMGGVSAEVLQKMVDMERAPSRELVRQGYAVLTSDYRHRSHLNLEVDDTIAAYDFLCNHPRVIKDKVALCGTSHGAVCAIYAAMRIDPACVVAEEGATDLAYRYKILHELLESHKEPLKGNLKLDKELWDELAERLGGAPSEAPAIWAKASGHTQAEKINSPILIVTGNGEYAPHCFQMYAALLKAKKNCEFAFFQTPRHGFWWSRKDDPVLAQADERIFSFLKKYLKD